MKKSNYFILFGVVIIFILAIVLFFKTNTYQVVFAVHNEEYKTIEVRKNTTIKDIFKPEEDGSVFLGWYDKDGIILNKETKITKDTVFYAKWGVITTE